MDISTITQSARIATDEQGQPIVVLPLSLSQEIFNQVHLQAQQDEQIKALLRRWESDPEVASPEWWDEFDADLQANGLAFAERDLEAVTASKFRLNLLNND